MIEILLEHAWFLVINKPSGMLTQAVPGIESVQTTLIEQLSNRDRGSPRAFIGMPHRLDRVTSGAMVVARNQRALRRLSDQFAARKVRKIYYALVPQMIEHESQWHDYLRKVPEEARAEIVSRETEGAKEAILSYRVVSQHELRRDDTMERVSLVEIELETGRMHQIRLQFGSRGLPILGDVLYGSHWKWMESEPGQRESPIALHAGKIEFHNPQNAEGVSMVAPLPKGWPEPQAQP
jgi:23S rRNA pseudouridine1911/1915/1917 synthase